MKKDNNKFSIRDRIRSFKYAWDGIRYFARTAHNGWIHYIIALLVITLGIYFRLEKLEWLWLIQAIFIVFITEFINSAIEENVNLVTEEHHEKAKRSKDLAAAAVLLSAIYAIIIGLYVFYPHFRALFS